MAELEYKRKIKEYLQHMKGERIDAAAYIYGVISEQENPAAAFRFFVESSCEIESAGDRENAAYFTPSEVQEIENRCEKLIEGIVDKLIQQNLPADQFYEKLWSAIKENVLFETEKERIYALFRLWIDARIPYFERKEGLKLSNDRFREICVAESGRVRNAMFLLNIAFEQKTERSSLLLELIEQCESEEIRAVIMAQILQMLERRTVLYVMNKLSQKTISSIEDLEE